MIKKITFKSTCNQNKLRFYLLSSTIMLIVVLFGHSSLFAQNSNKIAQGFNFLIEANKNAQSNIRVNATAPKQITYPDMFKIAYQVALNPKTGQYENGLTCIIYTQASDILIARGISIHSVFPTFCTAWVTLDQITELSNMPEVTFIDSPTLVMPSNDVTVGSTGASLLHAGKFNNTAYKGDGVIVAIVDSGIDWDHPDFRQASDQTKSRILRIWDQTITPISGEASPSGFNYGVEYTQTQINDELDGTPAAFVREEDTNGHGTHVAGTAAGNGAAIPGTTKYMGVAPNADIVVVKGGNGSFTSTNIINSLTYLRNLATSLGKPIVVNMSLGGLDSAHDGSDTQETAVDAFTNSAAGRVVVIASGNDNGKSLHKQLSIAAGATGSLSVVVPTASASTATDVFQISAYANDNSAINVNVTTTSGDNLTVNSGSSSGSNSIMGGTANMQISSLIDAGSGDRKVRIFVSRNSNTIDASGTYTINLTNTGSSPITVDGWLVYRGADYTNTAITSGNSDYLVASPGCANNAITVGSYAAKIDWTASSGSAYAYSSKPQDDISTFSSRGPRRDNVQKPDITANGEIVISCLSSNSGLANSSSSMIVNGLYKLSQGTSMATPAVAGCVALLLQINNSATYSDIKNAINGTATKDSYTTASNNNTWGYGKIDVFRAASFANYCQPLERVTFRRDPAYSNEATNNKNSQQNLGDYRAATVFSPTSNGKLAGVYFKTGSTLTLTSFTIEVRSKNSNGKPGTLQGSLSVDPAKLAKYSWNYFDLSALDIAITNGSDYFITLVPNTGATFYIGSDIVNSGFSFYGDGTNWGTIQDLRIRSVVYNNVGILKPSVALASALGTDAQSVAINSVITNIRYNTIGATGATFAGLPAGVLGSWAGDVVTISGTPSVSGTYTYTVTLTVGCGSVISNGTITVNGTLPITLTNYTVKIQNNGALLNWATSVERNNSHFNILHSNDGKNFSFLASVKASTNGNISNQYVYKDINPSQGLNYYQLQQVDVDGKVNELGIRAVNFNVENTFIVFAYPNPTKDDVQLEFINGVYHTAKLFNSNGNLLASKVILSTDTEVSFDLSALSGGTYLIQLEGKATTIQKVIKN